LIHVVDLDADDDSSESTVLARFGSYDPRDKNDKWKWELANLIAILINSARDFELPKK
jgi:hypothetical protein